MKVCILSFTAIADDPRVRRQGDALAAAGHEVIALGVAGALSPAPTWPIVEVAGPDRSAAGKVRLATRVARGRRAHAAEDAYWRLGYTSAALRIAVDTRADVYQANDWWTLPLAARAAERVGARYAYDSHEWAVEENANDLKWRLLFPPFVKRIEEQFIGGAGLVSTVAQGIAERLAATYDLSRPPLVIRNMPAYQAAAFRRCGDPMVVLYHGVYARDRGLDALVASVAQWHPDRVLLMRGRGAAEPRLRQVAAGLGDRVRFVPPVPMVDLVPRANADADVGVHPLPATSVQTSYALPNKLFEYVMAGLAVSVADSPEMAAVVRGHGIGTLIAPQTADGIARAVNALDPPAVDDYKRHSLVAAKDLCWETEQARLIDAYDAMAAS